MSRNIEISDETYARIKDQINEVNKDVQVAPSSQADPSSVVGPEFIKSFPDGLVGRKFFFRTVTYHMVGYVHSILGNFAALEHASWVASSGRFAQAIKNGELSEVEPIGQTYINLETVVDFFPWTHELPDMQK